MTNTNETATADEQETAPEQETQEHNLAREAAKYRTRLREVEAQRDTLKEQLTAARRTELENQLGASLRNPSDLFALTGTTPADYLDDDLTINTDKATEAVKQLLTERPELARPAKAIIPGVPESATPVTLPSGSSLESALKEVMRI